MVVKDKLIIKGYDESDKGHGLRFEWEAIKLKSNIKRIAGRRKDLKCVVAVVEVEEDTRPQR